MVYSEGRGRWMVRVRVIFKTEDGMVLCPVGGRDGFELDARGCGPGEGSSRRRRRGAAAAAGSSSNTHTAQASRHSLKHAVETKIVTPELLAASAWPPRCTAVPPASLPGPLAPPLLDSLRAQETHARAHVWERERESQRAMVPTPQFSPTPREHPLPPTPPPSTSHARRQKPNHHHHHRRPQTLWLVT